METELSPTWTFMNQLIKGNPFQTLVCLSIYHLCPPPFQTELFSNYRDGVCNTTLYYSLGSNSILTSLYTLENFSHDQSRIPSSSPELELLNVSLRNFSYNQSRIPPPRNWNYLWRTRSWFPLFRTDKIPWLFQYFSIKYHWKITNYICLKFPEFSSILCDFP